MGKKETEKGYDGNDLNLVIQQLKKAGILKEDATLEDLIIHLEKHGKSWNDLMANRSIAHMCFFCRKEKQTHIYRKMTSPTKHSIRVSQAGRCDNCRNIHHVSMCVGFAFVFIGILIDILIHMVYEAARAHFDEQFLFVGILLFFLYMIIPGVLYYLAVESYMKKFHPEIKSHIDFG